MCDNSIARAADSMWPHAGYIYYPYMRKTQSEATEVKECVCLCLGNSLGEKNRRLQILLYDSLPQATSGIFHTCYYCFVRPGMYIFGIR